jgi:protein MpaA
MTNSVKSPAFDPPALVARITNAARSAGFRVEQFGEIAGCPLIGLTKRTAGIRPRVYVSSGIHGDEPAPPLAILHMLEAGVFDSRANWLICPLLNPIGFTRSTRETDGGVDLNRDYRHLVSFEIRSHTRWLRSQPNFALALCLHEDWESAGFYLYELNPTNRPTLAEPMIAAVSRVCPIETAAIIDGREADAPGIIRPIADPLLRELWPEAIYLRAHHTNLTYTLESPSAFPLEQRIAALRLAVETAISG